jgi:hypothetical protein
MSTNVTLQLKAHKLGLQDTCTVAHGDWIIDQNMIMYPEIHDNSEIDRYIIMYTKTYNYWTIKQYMIMYPI